MRMEELSNNIFIKETDTVERYLLNLVQNYFKNSNVASTTSREYIIKKAVERMKEEVTFDTIGVLSITLPDGEIRTGAVTITLEDLNGEPLISPKLSAFNVNFGTEQNTACEGNDPRLSDARKPLEHEHEVSDIIGLEGIVSSLIGKVERANEFAHEHSNQDVLNMLVYTGSNTSIDLTVLETLEDKVMKITDEIRKEVTDYKQEVSQKISDINDKISDTNSKVEELRKTVVDTNKEYYELSKQYTNTGIDNSEKEINENFDKLVLRSELVDIVKALNNVYTFTGSMNFTLSSVLNFSLQQNKQSIELDISQDILNELQERGQTLQDCQLEYIIQYLDTSSNEFVYGTLPYVFFVNNQVDGSIQVNTLYANNKLLVSLNTFSFDVPTEIQSATITYNVYSKQNIVL